ncbi:desmoglein-4 [Blautia pseudococcoides]|nr:desmoglein-4 [Blautia pseudococcoides]
MNRKKALLSLLLAISVFATPLTAYAAHTHSWGPTMFYKNVDEQPLPWEGKCVTRHVYNYHTCLTCGQSEVWESNSFEMSHKMVNNVCIYCGMGYARKVGAN